jgi:transketolase
VYIRTTRKDTPILYRNDEAFRIGSSKVLRSNEADAAAVVAAGITLHETLKAYEELKAQGIFIRVIDLYSIKPIDTATLRAAADDTGTLVTVEDHFPEGGMGEAVLGALAGRGVPVHSLAVRKMPKSGKPDELLDYEEISKNAIVRKVKEIIRDRE